VTTSWIEISGRKIKLYDDLKTQSINICKPCNTEGDYEQVFYFRGQFRWTEHELNQFGDLDTLVSRLRRRSYEQLQ
jgi:hypothetical protein